MVCRRHALGDLLDDFVARGTDLVLTLSGLRANAYTMTTYHHDTSYPSPPPITSITVANDAGPATTVATSVAMSSSATPPQIGSATFKFVADGVNDMVITFNMSVSGTITLNGFDVAQYFPLGTTLIIR